MGRCRGPGAWENLADLEAETWEDAEEDVSQQDERDQRRDDDDSDDDDEDVEEDSLKCSPVTVVYGHAGEWLLASKEMRLTHTAGRGLDIKPFSKGIDTGCVVRASVLFS
jgi:hypothetical protein